MLVFLSDVHMTDGSSGETIKSTAFKIFAENVQKLSDSLKFRPPEEIRLVLLGDIFDIIRSTKWLSANVRPWDNAGSEQEAIVQQILNNILSSNKNSLAELSGLREWAEKKNIPFDITYIIGNHDWLINRYPACRKAAAEALGIAGSDPFPSRLFEPGYKVFALHGDIYDDFNYMGNRDDSSIGDAIVIELLNKYPEQVMESLEKLVGAGSVTQTEADRVASQLKELDNIRPLLDAPSWVLMVANKTENEAVRRVIEEVWENCVDAFFEVPFIKKQDKFLWPDIVDFLQIALKLSSHTSKKTLEKIAGLKEKWFPGDAAGGYDKYAFAEPRVRSGEANFVLYGHTHDYLMVPMDQTPLPDGLNQDKIYFNTGTWRKTWNKVRFDSANREFIGWHVLAYVTIFKPSENGPYNFEVWNAALG
jgi:UDP-2,3-diacylglucosamine pyrophosphatase LpxH